MPRHDRIAVEENLARRRNRRCAEEAFEQFGAPGTHQTGDPQDFPSVQIERDVFESVAPGVTGPGQGQVSDFEYLLASLWPWSEIERFDISTYHELGDLSGVGLLGRERFDELSISHDGDAIGQIEDLVHLVGDIEDGGSLAPEFGDDPIESLDLRFGKCAGRLVHDDDSAVDAQCLGDLDKLLVAYTQGTCESRRRDIAVERLQDLGCGVVHLAIVSEDPTRTHFATEEDVRRDRQLFDQVQFLVDDANAHRFCIAGPTELDGLSIDEQLAIVVGDHPREDFHERAFTRPVFAADGMDFAGHDIERDLVQSPSPAETLADVLDRDDRRGHEASLDLVEVSMTARPIRQAMTTTQTTNAW